MQVEQRAIVGGSTEQGALLFLGNCSICHGKNGEGVPGKGPNLNPDLFTKHFPQVKSTLGGFGGTVKDFIRLTIAGGRPIETAWAATQGGFPQRMPTWGQPFGGPLTMQQVGLLPHLNRVFREQGYSRPRQTHVRGHLLQA